jgi:hypothetical protein
MYYESPGSHRTSVLVVKAGNAVYVASSPSESIMVYGLNMVCTSETCVEIGLSLQQVTGISYKSGLYFIFSACPSTMSLSSYSLHFTWHNHPTLNLSASRISIFFINHPVSGILLQQEKKNSNNSSQEKIIQNTKAISSLKQVLKNNLLLKRTHGEMWEQVWYEASPY